MKNKRLRKVLLTIGMIITLKMYVNHNLTYHSVYYATNLPHKEGTNPVLVMVMKNLDEIRLPEGYIVGSYGGFTSPPHVKNSDISMIIDHVGVYKLHTSVYFDEKTGEYLRDSIYDKELVRDVPFTDEQRQEFLAELDEFLSDIVEVQFKPIINLQWLFNSRYEKQFNE